MAKQKKKSTKRRKNKKKIDWSNLLPGAVIDFIIGFLLLVIDKLIDKFTG